MRREPSSESPAPAPECDHRDDYGPTFVHGTCILCGTHVTEPSSESVAPADDPDRVVPLMPEPRIPIVLADGSAGEMRRCGHCGGNLSIPAPGEPSSESPALDDEIAPEDIHVHYGPVGGVGVDPAPLLARIESLETSLQLAQGALREIADSAHEDRDDLRDYDGCCDKTKLARRYFENHSTEESEG